MKAESPIRGSRELVWTSLLSSSACGVEVDTLSRCTCIACGGVPLNCGCMSCGILLELASGEGSTFPKRNFRSLEEMLGIVKERGEMSQVVLPLIQSYQMWAYILEVNRTSPLVNNIDRKTPTSVEILLGKGVPK